MCRHHLQEGKLNFYSIDRHLRRGKSSSHGKYGHLKNVERLGELGAGLLGMVSFPSLICHNCCEETPAPPTQANSLHTIHVLEEKKDHDGC